MPRLVKIATYYKGGLNYYYNRFPDVINLPYDKQLRHLLDFRLGWSDYYQKALEKLGFEAYEIIANAQPLQRRWAKDHGKEYSFLGTVYDQVTHLRPDIVWFQNSINFPADFVEKIRQLGVQLLIGNICSPYTRDHLKIFRLFDFVVTCSPEMEENLNKAGIKTLLIYHAFSPDVLSQLPEEKKKYNTVFVGSLINAPGFHDLRIKILDELIRRGVEMEVFANVQDASLAEVLPKQIFYILAKVLKYTPLKKNFRVQKALALTEMPKWNKLPSSLRKHLRPAVFGLDMFRTVKLASISVDVHATVQRYAANMRLFETPGVGTILLTQNFVNLPELFEPDKEVITYSSTDEAKEKINYLLDHPTEAEKIARAAQKRVLKDHTYDNRARILKQEIEKHL